MAGIKQPKRVYFLKPVGASGPIKIGASLLLGRRINYLSGLSPVPLELIAEGLGHHGFERLLHRIFSAERVHGEWFNPSPELMRLIARIANGETLQSIFGPVPVDTRAKLDGFIPAWAPTSRERASA